MIVYTAAFDGQPPELYSVRRDYPDSQPVGIKGRTPSRRIAQRRTRPSALGQVSGSFRGRGNPGNGSDRQHHPSRNCRARYFGGLVARWQRSSHRPLRRQQVPRGVSSASLSTKLTAGSINFVFSPDGKHLAFLQHPYGSDDRGDVMVSDLSGSMRKISTGWEAEEGLS